MNIVLFFFTSLLIDDPLFSNDMSPKRPHTHELVYFFWLLYFLRRVCQRFLRFLSLFVDFESVTGGQGRGRRRRRRWEASCLMIEGGCFE